MNYNEETKNSFLKKLKNPRKFFSSFGKASKFYALDEVRLLKDYTYNDDRLEIGIKVDVVQSGLSRKEAGLPEKTSLLWEETRSSLKSLESDYDLGGPETNFYFAEIGYHNHWTEV